MKTLTSMLITATLLVADVVPQAHARESVSIDYFYDYLEPFGSWREVGDYGYCWQPYDVSPDWQPYSDGRWVYTDAGWTWDSYEPYSWVVYHYGRWADIEEIGWVWIPGTEWGPGWVSWRHSPRYVGWAPLPPEAVFVIGIGLRWWVDDYYDIGPRCYRFVENRNFGARRLNNYFIDQSRNITIIRETTNITNITYEGDVIHNGGLRFDQQSRISEEPLHRYKLDRRQEFDGDPRKLSTEQLRSRISGDSLSMMAPRLEPRPSAAPPKLKEKLDSVRVNRGWKNAGSPAEVDEARSHIKQSKKPTAENLPPRAIFDKTQQDFSRQPGDRPKLPKEDTVKPEKGRDELPRRPETTAPPMKKKPSPDRPPSPREIPSKPDLKRDDKPNRPDSPPPSRKPESVDRPKLPKDEPKPDKPKQQVDRKPQIERKPQPERKPQAEPRPQPRQQEKRPEIRKPEPQSPIKREPQGAPKGKDKPDEKDKDKKKR